MAMIAKCAQCGALDRRKQWSSADDAAKHGAFDGWTCPTCAWTDFELVETTTETGTQPAASDRR